MNRTILIIDNKTERVILNTYLNTDYDLIEAGRGDEAIEILRTNWQSVSAIVLGITMPGTDGLEALRKIRDNAVYRQIPVIVASEQNDDKMQVQALSLGATGVITTPYNKDILLPLLKNTIGLKEQSLLSSAFSVELQLGQEAKPKHPQSKTDSVSVRLKSLFEDINNGVSVVIYEADGALRAAYANEQYYKLFGYTKQQYMAELKSSHDTIYPDDWDKVAANIKNIKETKQAVNFRYRIIKRDKSIVHVRCSSSVTSVEGVDGFAMISILTDITESVQAEQQLLIYGQRLDAIMNNINSAVTAAIVKSNGTVEFLFLNDLYYKMFGYTKEQFQAEITDPFQLAYPDDEDTVRNAVFNLRGIGETKELLYRGITRDGKMKWFKAHITIMTFPDADEPVQLSVYSDVTDIINAQEKIAAQRDQIASLLNDTPSGIAIIEVDPTDIAGTMRTTYYNDRFITYSGYDRDEYSVMIKKNEMYFVFAEDVPAVMISLQKICSGEVGTSADCVVRCHTKGGGYRWLLLTGQLSDKRGNTYVINVAMVDITKRQEAIDRQRINDEILGIAVETEQRAIIVYNVKMNTCRVECRTLFSARYGDVFENIPQSLIDMGVAAPGSVNELCSLFARIKNKEKKICVSLQMHSGADKFEWFECNAITVLDADGMPDHAVLVFQNITEKRIKEAVFTKWQQSIDTRPPNSYTLFQVNLSRGARLEAQHGTLLKLSILSDDMSFNSRAEFYSREYVFPDDREEYDSLLNSDTLLAMFYRGVHSASLDYREIADNGEVSWRHLTVEMVEHPHNTDVQAFLMYEDIDEKKSVEIAELKLAKSDPLTGALNRGAFVDKLENIIEKNPNTNSALIIVDMDGFKQINDTFGHTVGDRVLQEVTSVLRSYSGTNDLICRLGADEFLIWLRDIPYDAVIAKTAQQMCEHIRKAYGKEVTLSASIGIAVYPRDGHSYDELYHKADKALYKVKRSGKGAYAFFSTTNEEQTTEITEALSEVKTSPQSLHSAKRRILIVDDNESNRLILRNIFKDEYLIETAKNGTEAMLRLRHFGAAISVVLLDLLMPGMDGFSVLKRMQNDIDLRTIPIIVVTGDENRETLLKAFNLGASEYVVKPVDTDIIRMRVQSVIGKAENERLRAQNSYLMLQRNEEMKYRTVLDSTGTSVVEYDWRNHIYIYDDEISKHIAGKFDLRGLWQIFLSDMVADSADVKALQEMLIGLAGNREKIHDRKLVKLKTPQGVKHWFRVNFYKTVDDFGLAEKMIITLNDVHEEILANEKLLFQATRDELTGLYNRTGFLGKTAELIKAQEPGYYVMSCIDVEKFQIINDRYGIETGDRVLKHIASAIGVFEKYSGICCRYMADKFAIMYPAKLIGTDEFEKSHRIASSPDCIPQPLRLRVGRCMVNDVSLSVNAIFDRAAMAEAMAKGRYDTYIVDYDETMRDRILKEQQITNDMVDALNNGEFVPWFQPQYNHETGALIGAEALVRWHKDGRIVPPNEFVPVFERNGFIYEVDRYIWRSVCILLRRWLDEGKKPLPISVNISRYDLLQNDFIESICSLSDEYKLPVELLRLEVTESAFSKSSEEVYAVVNKLIAKGYTVEIDDFGSGYSSLNTLKDVPASILKLDMRFFERTGDAKRGGSIVESVVRMAKWLGMAVIAEGVEDMAQADYLKSIGCVYIQGYLYAKPMPVDEYEKRFDEDLKETKLSHIQTLQHLDNNDFWDSHSMDSLIFNSYVGAACIFELHNGKVDMLRATDHYVQMLCGNAIGIQDVLAIDWAAHMDDRNIDMLMEAVKESLETRAAVTWKFEFHNLPGCPETVILRSIMRVIAITGDRYLIYCLNENITKQSIAEREIRRKTEHINAVLKHTNIGICAVIARSDGTVEMLFVNDRFFEMMGYTREQYAAEVKSPYDRVVTEDRDRIVEAVLNLNKVGGTVTIELREIRRDGSIVWLRCNASTVRFEAIDEPVQLSNFLDITEQKENEMKQLENARQLEVVLSNINGGVSAIQVFADATSRFVFCNDKYYDLYGYTKEEALAQNLDVMKLIHPEDLPSVMAKIRQLKKDHQPSIIDYRITKKNGSHAMLRSNASLMRISGYDDDVITSVVTDITERKSLEERLDAIIDNINGGISAIYRKKDKPEYAIANEQYFRILGYTKEEFESEGVNPFDLVHPDDRERVMKMFNDMHNYGERYTMEYRMIRRDGSVRNILCNTSVLQLFGIDEPLQLAVTNDITALREIQRQELAVKERLSTVMNVMSNGITAVALHGDRMQFLFANNRFYEIHGIRRGDVGEGDLSSVLELAIPKDRDALRKTVNESVQTKKTVSTEYQIQHPDGVIRWVRTTISMTKLADIDDPVQVAVFTDITDEKKTNDQIRFLNDSAGEILAQPDSEKAINDTLNNLLGYFAGERAYIFELRDTTRTADNTFEVCTPGVTTEIHRLQGVPYDTQQYWFDAFDREGFAAISDVAAITKESQIAMRDLLLVQNIHSIIVAPLWRDDKLIGYMGIDNPTKALDQVSQLIALADYIAVLLTRRDLMKAVEHGQDTVQQLMDDTPGGFLRLRILPDSTPVIVSLNVGFCRMLGMTTDEVMASYGDNAHKCLVAEDIETVKNSAGEALSGNGEYTYKCRLKRKDGAIIWVQVFGRYVKDENDELFRNSFFNDITEQRNAEQLQSALLDNLPLGAAMYEYDGKTLTAIHINKQCNKMVNREVNISLAGYSPINSVHPDDRIIVINEIRSAIAEQRKASCDVRLLYGKDEYRFFRLDATIIPSVDDKYILYVAYERITDQELEFKKTSEQLKLLSDSIPGGIATFRCMPGNIVPVFYNDGICALTGYSREEMDHNSISVLEMIFDEDHPVIRKQIELLISGETVLDYSVRIHTKNGDCKWVECMANVTGREDNNVFLVSAVLTDVTEQQEEKEQLRLAEEEYRITTEHSARTICRYNIADQSLKIAHEAANRFDMPVVLQGVPYAQIEDGSVSSDTVNNYLAFFEGILHGVKESACVYCRKLNNAWRWLSARATSIFDLSGKQVSAIISFTDITEAQEKELAYKKWKQSLTERKPEQFTLYCCNLNKDSSYDTKEGRLFGFAVESREAKLFNECTDVFCNQYVVKDDRSKYIEFLDSNRLLASYYRGVRSGELIFRAIFGEDDIRWIRLSVELLEYPGSTDIEAYLMYEDINDSMLEELKIKKQAETDTLTGLQNRKAFLEHINCSIKQKKVDSFRALFLLDIDYFKHINDTFGHHVGDESIVSIANVILSVIGKDGVACRLGGDEFLVCLPDMPSRDSVADKARELCEASHIVVKNGIQISVSIGVALFTDEGDNFDSMYHKADKALYHVKGHGKNNFAFYDTDMEKDDNEVMSDAVGGSLMALADGKTTMLVVDDSAINRVVTAGMFKKEFEIVEAENGQVALDYLREHADEVAIVLLDIMMPVMDGYGLLAVMRADSVLQEIPVIVISGEDDRKASLRAIQAGASDYVVKPVDADLLRLRVSSALSKSENGRLRMQNSNYAVDSQELHSYRSLMDSNATVLIEYNAKTETFKYAPKTGDYLNGTFDQRLMWQILAEDKIASDADVETIHKLITESDKPCKATFDLITPDGTAHPFLLKVILRDVTGDDDVILITLTDRK